VDEGIDARSGNGVGVASAICGVVALVLSWIPFVDYTSLVLGALAIIFGVLGIRRANADPGARKAPAIIGMVCGIAGFAIAAIVLLLIYALVTTINVAGG
jgi:membrane associated rhomboid family serine protease